MHRDPFAEEEEDEDAAGEREGNVALAPKVKIVDGKLVLDQDSLTVTTGGSQKDQLIYTRTGEHAISSWSYSNRKTPTRWNDGETTNFYRALAQCGTDFSMMERMMAGRSRTVPFQCCFYPISTLIHAILTLFKRCLNAI